VFGIDLAVSILDGPDLSEQRRKELALARLMAEAIGIMLANFISIKALGSHFERADCLPILDFGSQRTCKECLRTTRLPNAQTKSTRPRPLWLTKLHGRGARYVVVSHGIDPRAHGIAPHEPSIVGLEQFGRRSRVPHPRIEPQVVAVWVEDDGHAVVDG
jgi:hypothetical protein